MTSTCRTGGAFCPQTTTTICNTGSLSGLISCSKITSGLYDYLSLISIPYHVAVWLFKDNLVREAAGALTIVTCNVQLFLSDLLYQLQRKVVGTQN